MNTEVRITEETILMQENAVEDSNLEKQRDEKRDLVGRRMNTAHECQVTVVGELFDAYFHFGRFR